VTKSGASAADRNFVVQQGLEAPEPASCGATTSSLLFQPRVVAVWIAVGIVLQNPLVFAALSAVLWWNALVPRSNPFDAVYNAFFAGRSGAPRLATAPGPRRFSQGMAGTFAAVVALCIYARAGTAAGILEAIFAVAVGALVFGRFCLGSFVFHLLRGRVGFAMRTLPWGPGDR
jgi:Domain of unknown function (DUF4395)